MSLRYNNRTKTIEVDDAGQDLTFNTTQDMVFQIGGATKFEINNSNARFLFNDWFLFVEEQAAAGADLANYGQIWVKNDAPNNLYFTDDTGQDIQITNNGSLAGGSVTSVAAGNGLDFTTITGTGSVTLGTPGAVTSASTDAVTATSHTHSLAAGAVTLAKMADVATSTVFYRKTAATGVPEVQTLATLKTDLGLTGTNSGDQTITLTGDVTGTGTGSFAATIAADSVTMDKIQDIATDTFLGRVTAATGTVEVLTNAQAKTALDLTGTNSGDEPAASLTVAGIVELATVAETNTGTDATRAVTPDGLDGWTGSAQLTTAGALTATSFTDSTLSATGVLYAGTGGIIENNASNFVWDNTNSRLVVGGVLNLVEQADHSTSPVGGRGEVWVKSGSLGGELMYTDGDQDNDFTAYNVIETVYHFDQTTTAADPGAGNMRWNNVTPASVTNWYLDDLDETGRDASFLLANLADGDILTLRSMWSDADYMVASVNGTPTDNTGYWTVPVTVIHSNSLPATGDPCHITVEWASQAGSSGTVTSVAAGNGLDFTTITTTGSVTMGTPGSLSSASTNAVTATSHTHAITSIDAADVAAGSLASGVNPYITGNGAATAYQVLFANTTSGTSGATALYKDSAASQFTYNPSSNTLFATNITGTNIGGITQANLVDKTATETVSGSWTHTATWTIENTQPVIRLNETGVTANEGNWRIEANAEQFLIRTDVDAENSPVTAMSITRTGTTPGTVDFNAAVTATSYGGITEANLVDKSATETITGTWSFDGSVTESDFGTGAKVKDGTDVLRPVGFNTIPIYEIDAADTFDLAHVGMLWHKDAGAAVTFTCASDTTIPVGATYMVHNDDTEDLTITGSTATVYWLAPGAAPAAGDVIVEQGGIVTVYKYADAEFWVWGAKAASSASNVTVTTSTTNSAFKIPFANTTASTTGDYGLLQDSTATFTYNPSTNTITAGAFSGATAAATVSSGNLGSGVLPYSTVSATASNFKVPFLNTTGTSSGNFGLLHDSTATFTYNASTNTLVAGTFSGALSGNATTATTATNATNVNVLQSTTSASRPFVFATSTTAGNKLLYTDSAVTCYINPSTNTIGATTFSGALSGNATTATTATNVTVADESADTACYPLFVTTTTGNLPPKSGTNLTFNSSTGDLGATIITPTTRVQFNDNIEARFGTGGDVDMYFNSLDFYIDMPDAADFRLRGGAANDNMIIAYDDAQVELYHNGGLEFRTQQHELGGNTSGAEVYDHAGTLRDVGFNHVKEVAMTTGNITLSNLHAGTIIRRTGTSTVTLTIEDAVTTEFPVGSMCTVLNHGTTGSLTISDDAGNLYIMDGSGTVTNSTGFVLAVGGCITLWRQATASYYVWGAGIP